MRLVDLLNCKWYNIMSIDMIVAFAKKGVRIC